MSPPAGSTLITSAPRSPRIIVQKGPASARVRSRTRTPDRGRVMGSVMFSPLVISRNSVYIAYNGNATVVQLRRPMRKPNILFIMADQLSAPALPFHGNHAVKAPHLQALAERSAVFDNAYCNFPLCARARFSVLAGQFATHIGAFDNACEFQADTPTLPYYLARQGYKTILGGKLHLVGPHPR